MRIIGMGFALLALLLGAVGGMVMAQNSCANPFSGVLLRFETDFWTKTDFCQRSVDISEIRSGGPPPDGIPPIDNPVFESIDLASLWLQDQSPVIALEIDGDARAYPLAILTWHEIANDLIGDVPVAVTFCPLCNSAIVFDRRVGDATLRLGVSGLLRNSDMVMWDDLTQSFWQQFTGEGIVGAYTGTQLTIIPSLVIGFGAFADEYPDGVVLSRDTGRTRSYGANPYIGYDSSPQPFLFEGSVDPRLPATEHVLGGLVAGTAVAYPFPLLRERTLINDVINEVPVAAFYQDGVASALDQSSIDASRDIGTAALYDRRLDDRELTFTLRDGAIYDEQTGSRWNTFGRAVEGELAGSQLRRLNAGAHFWFAWAAFRPETILRTT
jgi:hypothetical protein